MTIFERMQKLVKDIPKMSTRQYVDESCSLMADMMESYDLLKASFDANADETIALRKRFEDLWRVKQDLENDVARLKKESNQILNDAIANIDRKANRAEVMRRALTAVRMDSVTWHSHLSAEAKQLVADALAESV